MVARYGTSYGSCTSVIDDAGVGDAGAARICNCDGVVIGDVAKAGVEDANGTRIEYFDDAVVDEGVSEADKVRVADADAGPDICHGDDVVVGDCAGVVDADAERTGASVNSYQDVAVVGDGTKDPVEDAGFAALAYVDGAVVNDGAVVVDADVSSTKHIDEAMGVVDGAAALVDDACTGTGI